MKSYFLQRNAFYCVVDGAVVFLDTRNHAYLAVDSMHLQELSESIVGWPTPAANASDLGSHPRSCSLLRDLIGRGLLTASRADGKAAEPLSLPVRRSLPSISFRGASRPCRALEFACFLHAAMTATVRLGMKNFAPALRRIEQSKVTLSRRAAPLEETELGRLVHTFERLRVWCYSAENACLKDSLILADFLLRLGVAPTFAIGVRTRPFAAHAWVQSGDMVLNDSAENVLRYTPIVAI